MSTEVGSEGALYEAGQTGQTGEPGQSGTAVEASADVLPSAEPRAVVLEELVDMKSTVPAELSGSLLAASVVSVAEGSRRAVLRLGGVTFEATLDAALSLSVVRTALASGERLIVQREGDQWVVLGALRTAPVPGVDEGDEFTLRARRITLIAEHEASVRAGAASLVLRAQGYVETVAKDITSRASSVHKIVGRMLRLN